jgi:hypothetical protein
VAFDAPRRDWILTQDFAAIADAPARLLQRGINVLGSGFGFVHPVLLLKKKFFENK